MRIQQWHKNILKKPKQVRSVYAFWSAVGITGVIALTWLIHIPFKIDRIVESTGDDREASGNFRKVFEDARENFQSSVSALRSQTELEQSAGNSSSTNEESSDSVESISSPAEYGNIDFNSFFVSGGLEEEELPPQAEGGDEQSSDEATSSSPDQNDSGENTVTPSKTHTSVDSNIEPRRVLIATSSASTDADE